MWGEGGEGREINGELLVSLWGGGGEEEREVKMDIWRRGESPLSGETMLRWGERW